MEKEEDFEDFDSSEKSEVRFVINKYKDIFSDFDPRPLSKKGFSDDFLSEAKRAIIVKEEKVDFIFMVPREERNLKEETRIEKRLKQYFGKRLDILEKETKRMIKRGFFSFIISIVLMFAATYFFFTFKNTNFVASFFIVLLEPASWFLFWEGLDLVIFETKKASPDLIFYRRMTNARIKFISV